MKLIKKKALPFIAWVIVMTIIVILTPKEHLVVATLLGMVLFPFGGNGIKEEM